MQLLLYATFWGFLFSAGFALQIQCYQCEEYQLNNDCSAPEFIVNCTVNVQDMCQKEEMVTSKATAGQEVVTDCLESSWTHSGEGCL
nr:PREDICTED: ly6/PLAUR domain-containing protein 1 isoform X2 [Latimeria chalumnae]|eukprot:XP_014348509.1 PREDICTED: ly6/PLAUR domain-containing protein 1 isoform X2 [Latimeria chalumnae]